MLDKFDTALLKKIGIKDVAGIFAPVVEENRKGRVFFKFMSDGGARDDELGRAMRSWLTKKKIPYDSAPSGQLRSFAWIDRVALEKAVGLPIFEDA